MGIGLEQLLSGIVLCLELSDNFYKLIQKSLTVTLMKLSAWSVSLWKDQLVL